MPIRLTQSVKFLIITYFVSFLIQQTADQFLGMHVSRWFALNPHDFVDKFHFWQLLTYSFVHSDVMHVFFNLMMIAFIGSELEAVWGARRFLQYYFFCATSCGVIYILLTTLILHGMASQIPMSGTSGAIYGLLLAYGILFGERVLHFMMLFPLKAKHFIWILVLLELLTTFYSSGGRWAGLAQLGGMAAGFGFLWVRTALILAKKSPTAKWAGNRSKKRRSKHLKLIVNNDQELDELDKDSERDPKTWH